jgi:transcription elongation factor SPT6
MRNFIATKKPHVICVGAESREAMMVAADLREIIGQLVEDEQFPSISVEICDNELAKIYSNSIKGEVSNAVIMLLLLMMILLLLSSFMRQK